MFKKIYYINLEHRTDRREHVEDQLSKINFNGTTERINAANGKNLDNLLIPTKLFTQEAICSTTRQSEINNTLTMTKGGMGLSISQKWIYEKVLTGEEDYVLIVEDDITFADNFMEKVTHLINKIGYFDMLWLGYHTKVDTKRDRYVDTPLKIWGLFGYIINKKAAKELVDMFPITKQLDTEIPRVFPKLKVYAVKQNNILISSPKSEESTQFGSDIQFYREDFMDDLDEAKNNPTCNIIMTSMLLIIIVLYLKKIINNKIFMFMIGVYVILFMLNYSKEIN